MRFLERKEDRVSHPPGTFLHSPPRGKPRHSATKRKEKLSIGETEKGENPRPFTGLPAVAAVSYLGLRGAPLYRRTATLDSLPLRLSLLVFQPSPPDPTLRYLATFLPPLPAPCVQPAIEIENNSRVPGPCKFLARIISLYGYVEFLIDFCGTR